MIVMPKPDPELQQAIKAFGRKMDSLRRRRKFKYPPVIDHEPFHCNVRRWIPLSPGSMLFVLGSYCIE